MSFARVIVGLGNPGTQYEHTRHNAGFEVVDRLAQRLNCDRWKTDFQGVIGDVRLEMKESGGVTSATVGDSRLLLVKPQTFMNLSGACVQPLLAFYKVAFKDCLVVVDEMNLALGDTRLRQNGSHGGHNGLRDI
ncbi:MAG TPA: aminoacyl-tRNA hydrolase, partial [Planctomycetota bacterium]|nr:aminoacyl-tRNA hydrolase [Planctomycetota bacterium]